MSAILKHLKTAEQEMILNGKVRQTFIKPTIRQKVWNYIRRNRVFMISDVMAITGANYKNLKEMFKVYENAGYIKVLKRQKPFSSTQLKLIKCTGVRVPTHDKDKNILFDYNTGEEIEIKSKSAMEKILDCLDKGLVTKEEINKKTALSFKTVTECYADLKERGVMARVVPTRKNQLGHRLFSVDLEKVKVLKESFESQRYTEKANIEEKLKKKSKSPQVPPTLLKLLDTMTEEKDTKRNLDRKAELRMGTAKHYWSRLISHGIVSAIKPLEKDGKGVLFSISPEKAQEFKEKLLRGEEKL